MTDNGDISTQQQTYAKVIGMLKYGGAVCFALAFGVIYVLTMK